MKKEKLPVICRPARESDTADVMDLTRKIWDGEDYVPHVWAGWLADREGRLAVAEFQGRVVGLGKLTRLGPADWWLEGLRVHPELEGRGVASRLHEYLVDYWRRTAGGVLRLATNSRRLPVHHLSRRTGFEQVAEFSFVAAPALPGPASAFQPLAAEDAPGAIEFALRSQTLALSGGLMDLGWQWAAPSVARLQAAARLGRAWWWQSQVDPAENGLLVVTDETDTESGPALLVSLLACSLASLPNLLEDYRRLAYALGFGSASWTYPLRPELLALLEPSGFSRRWDDSLFVYALAAG